MAVRRGWSAGGADSDGGKCTENAGKRFTFRVTFRGGMQGVEMEGNWRGREWRWSVGLEGTVVEGEK